MSTYTPDRWVIIKIQTVGHESYYRILAGWVGGYTTGDSWKLSSGIEKSFDRGNHYEIPNSSGSIYICYKGAYGLSGYTSSIFANFKAQAQEAGMLFEIVDKDFIPLLEVGESQKLIPKPKQKKPRKLTKKELKDLDF